MRFIPQRVFPTAAQKAAADSLGEDRRGTAGAAWAREVGNEFNNLAHYFNAGGTLDVDSGNRLTKALKQLEVLRGEVQAMTRNFWEKGHTYPRKNP